MHSSSDSAPPSAYSIVVIENQDVVRLGLHSLAITHPHIVGSLRMYADVEDIDFAGPSPDVVVLDYWLGLDNRSSVHKVPALKAWGANVLLYTSEKSPFRLREALRLGLDGLCLKTDGVDALARAIATAGAGAPVFSSPLARAVLDDSSLGARLTATEIETLRGLSYGLSHAQIATRSHVAKSTVDKHVEHIREKYAQSTGEPVNAARILREGLRDGYWGAQREPREDP